MDPKAKEELAEAIRAAGDNQLVQGATRVLSVLQKWEPMWPIVMA